MSHPWLHRSFSTQAQSIVVLSRYVVYFFVIFDRGCSESIDLCFFACSLCFWYPRDCHLLSLFLLLPVYYRFYIIILFTFIQKLCTLEKFSKHITFFSLRFAFLFFCYAFFGFFASLARQSNPFITVPVIFGILRWPFSY